MSTSESADTSVVRASTGIEPAPHHTSLALADRRGRHDLVLALSIALLALAVFSLLSLRIPIASEVRYIEAAREMVESGDWTVPHLAYVPYFEKPILLYWAAALSQLIAGDSLVAARLPSILASTVSVLVAFAFARRLGGRVSPPRAALILLGSGYFLMFGSVLITDPLFAMWLWAAWYCYWESLQRSSRAWKWGFWACVSLGFMTKGPLSIILVLGSIGLFHVVDTPWPSERRGWWRDWTVRVLQGARTTWRESKPWIGAVVLLAINLPWSFLVLARDARFLEFFYVRENFKAFFDGSVHHRQPVGFYGEVILAAFVPWSLLVIIGLFSSLRTQVVESVRGRRDGPARDPADRLRAYLAAIVVFTLLFLQVSSAKLASYILPILPAMALLAVDAWSRAEPRRLKWFRWALFANSIVLVAAMAVYASKESETVRHALETVAPSVRTLVIGALAFAATGLLAGGATALLGRLWTGIAICGASVVGLVITVSPRLGDLNLGLNAARLASIVAERETPGDLVVASSQFLRDYTIHLAVRHRIGYLGAVRELGMGHFAESTPSSTRVPDDPYRVSAETLPDHPWLFTRERLIGEWRSTRRIWLICPQKIVDELARAGIEMHLLGSDGEALLYSNRK